MKLSPTVFVEESFKMNYLNRRLYEILNPLSMNLNNVTSSWLHSPVISKAKIVKLACKSERKAPPGGFIHSAGFSGRPQSEQFTDSVNQRPLHKQV